MVFLSILSYNESKRKAMICPKCANKINISTLMPKWFTGYLSWKNQFSCEQCNAKLMFRKSEYILKGHIYIVVATIVYLLMSYILAITLQSHLVFNLFLLIFIPVYIYFGRLLSFKVLDNCEAYLNDG